MSGEEWVCPAVDGGSGWVLSGGVGMSKGPTPTPLSLTASGDYHKYSRQASGMHPTGMLSCLFIPLHRSLTMFLMAFLSLCTVHENRRANFPEV